MIVRIKNNGEKVSKCWFPNQCLSIKKFFLVDTDILIILKVHGGEVDLIVKGFIKLNLNTVLSKTNS